MKTIKKTLIFMLSVLVLIFLKSSESLAVEAQAITLTDESGNHTIVLKENGDQSGTGWSYIAESNTLTLSEWSGRLLASTGDFNLVLSGTNTITMADENNSKAIDAGTINISGSSSSDKLVIKGDLKKSFYGIVASLNLCDNAHIEMNIKSTSDDWCYGVFSGTIKFLGSNSSIDADVSAPRRVYALSTVIAGNTSTDTCGDGNTLNVNAKSLGPYEATAIGSLYVYKANPVITVSATNDGTKPELCYGVELLQGLLLTEGGKLDATGMVCVSNPLLMSEFNRNIVTTTPADNAYYWDVHDGTVRKNVLYKLDGTICYHTVFIYSSTPAELVWYGDGRFTLSGGKVGDYVRDYGNSYYLHDYIRGLDGYNGNSTFTIKSGSFPEGVEFGTSFGSIAGRFTKECPAGSLVITVTNNTSGNSIDFTVNYGAVTEAEKFININGEKISASADASGTGWSYAAAGKTLTLNNYSGGKISSEIALNIVLKGSNVITLKNEEYAAALESSEYITITGEKSTDKLTIQGDLTQTFRAINCPLNIGNNAHIALNVKSSNTSKSYGAYQTVYLTGDNASLDVNVTSAGTVYGLSSLQAHNYNTKYSGSGNVVNVDAKSTGDRDVVAVDFLYVYNANPVITVSAANDGTKPDYCYGVNMVSDLLFTSGGKLDATGLVCSNLGKTPTNINRHIVTTTPADNAYFWDRHTGARIRNTLHNVDGTVSYHTVFEYSSTLAELVWYGDGNFILPGGKVGDSAKDNGYAHYLTDYIRGLDGYDGDSTFEIKSGTLPEGVTFGRYFGNIDGSFTKKCDAGSVEITVTNNKSKNSLDFTLNYGAVTSAKPVTGLTLSTSNLTVGMNANKTFNATITPADASDKSISVSSSDENIARAVVGKDNADGSTIIYVFGIRVGTVTITVTANDTKIKKTVTVSVKDSVPNAKIDYREEQFTGLVANADYIITVGETSEDKTASTNGKIDIAEAYMGKTVSIVKKGAVASENSDPQEIAVPARPAAPADCSFVKPSNKTTPDGTLILGATYREYKLESATEWKKASTSTEIPYVGIGTYNVRDAADETRFTGLAATVTIVAEDLAFKNTTGLEIPAGTVHVAITDINLYNYVGGGRPSYTFTKVSGPDWINVSAGGYITGSPTAEATATTLTVKVTDEDSEEKTLDIPVGAVSLCVHSGGTASCSEYAICETCGQPYGALLAHDYNPATCKVPKTCKNCGATEGVTEEHTWSAADCTNASKCTKCGDEHPTNKALGHDWKDADCTHAKTCRREGCGATEGEALGHNWKAATCTEPAKCQREGCNAIGDAALGHNWKEATCTDPKTCQREGCGATEGEALGHDFADATCTNPATCRKCKATMGDIVPDAHIVVTDPAVAPTCTKKGKTEGSHCSECKKVLVAQKSIAAKGHTKVNKVTPATVKSDGSVKTYCKVCNKTLSTTTIYKAIVTVYETHQYTGKAITPVKIIDSTGKTINSKYYKIAYKNNKKVGKATATVTFSGNYKGSKSVSFDIVKKDIIPAKVKDLKVTAASKALKISWKKGSSVTDGYEIQYSTDKNFLSGVVSTKVTKAATTSATISKLKSKTSYYVRIRAYNKDGKTTAYSAWTTYKSAVKTK